MRAGVIRHWCRAAVAWLSALSVVAVMLGGVADTAGAVTSSHLLRYPYLTDATAGAALVNFATDAASPAPVVTFGPAGGTCATSAATATGTAITVNTKSETQFKAQLTGLSANSSYCYRVLQNGVDLLGSDPSPSFTSAAAPGDSTPYSFAVVGDWGAGTPDEANVLSRIASSPAKFVVTVGDNAYNSGTQTDYGDLLGGNVFAPNYWKGVGATRPVYAAQGNHGFTTHLPYLQNFPEPSVVQASGGRLQQESYCCIPPMASNHTYASAWYAFDWGSARYYVLEAAWADSQGGYAGDFYAHWNAPVPGCPACGTELQWLKADLAAHANTAFKFAFFHYPLYSDSPSQSSDTYLQGPNGLEGLLAKNNVNIVFNGHAHNYERNHPQIPGSPMVSYITGGGGDALGSIGCSAFDAYAVGSGRSCNAPTPTSSAQVFHFLLVTISGNTVTVTPTDSTGRTFDVQSYTTNAARVTTIDSGPAALTNATTATFTFHSTVAGATFACTLDAGAASPCSSPATFNGLAPGSHTLTIATTAPSGSNPAPASSTWTVDTSPPSIPAGVTANAVSGTKVNVSWAASTDDTGVTGYDVLRDGSAVGSVAGTTTTFSDTTALPSTTYQYTVDARDGAGNVSVASTPATVTTPVQTTITPALVQWAGSTSKTVTFPATTIAGNLLVLSAGVSTGISQPITAVSDGKNTWTKIGAFAVSGKVSDGEMWYTANAASVGSVTVTTGGAGVALLAQEFSGVATTSPLDVSGGAANTSTAASSGAVTPTASNDLAVGFAAGHGSTQAMNVTAPGYATQAQQNNTANTTSVVAGYQALTSSAAQTFTAGFGSAMYWAAGIATFKASSTPPPPPPNDFSMAANPNTVTVTAGQSGTSSITTTLTSGAAQNITLSATGLPAGASASFNPASVSSGQSSTMTITTSATTPAASSTVTITGTGTTATHTTTLTLTVSAPVADDFSMAANPNTVTVTAGQSGTSSITTTLISGAAQNITLSATGLPTGANASFNPATIASGQSSTMTITTTTATPAASSTVTITGTGTTATHTTTLTLTVSAPVSDDFSMAANPNTVTVTAGQSGTSSITTTLTSGAAQNITLSATGLPAGASASFNPASVSSGQSSTMTITTSATTPAASSTITITGTGTTATHTTTLTLTVNAPVTGSAPQLVQAAGSTSATVTFAAPTTTGSLLVLSAGLYTGITKPITAVTDGKNTWTKIGAFAVSGKNSDGEIWYAANAAPVTSITVTTGAAAVALQVQEFSGVATAAPLDVSIGTSNTGTSASSGSVTPVGPHDLVVGFIAGHANTQPITVTATGFTNQPQQTSGSGSSIASVVSGYQVLSAASPQAYTGTFTSSMNWAAAVVCFKAAS